MNKCKGSVMIESSDAPWTGTCRA